ncbi:hypothetical protein [Streptomyces sp. GbtcB6]|uniref:hypothetical protein n=1 Tax=Streptomyces sp. GbtcB6 TaxID=2824751 RepID=UPI0027E50E4B|nr:hypothetical protein [Streptomyces sp. GbtcB6]
MGQRLNTEQLRTMALNATALITAAAATEYQHYVKVRDELRQPASSAHAPDSAEPGAGAAGLATALGEAAEPTGAGAVAVTAVLAPVLTGTATVIFLLVGYILKMFDPAPAIAQIMFTAGWVFGAVTAAAVLVAVMGLLLTAWRNRPAMETGPYGELSEEVTRARDAWHEALLERGILPFLREALADPASVDALHRPAPPAPAGRTPPLGHNRSGFTSPESEDPEPQAH